MSTFPAEVHVTSQSVSTLGEGTAWWARRGQMVTVDIAQGRVKYFDPETDKEQVVELGGEVSAVVPRRGGGKVAAVGHQLRAFDRDGKLERTWEVETDLPSNRFNDCRSDAAGRLWAGTMSKERTPNQAAVYRLEETGNLTAQISRTTLSNGMGWSADHSLMYFIDSTTYQIDVLDYDIESGTVSDRRRFVSIDPSDGLPDGLTMDSDGGIWVALFGGGAVRRYSSAGDLTHHIALPVTNPTCPAFGTSALDTLFVTSARIKLTHEQLSLEPAGSLLALPNLGFQGFAANECAI